MPTERGIILRAEGFEPCEVKLDTSSAPQQVQAVWRDGAMGGGRGGDGIGGGSGHCLYFGQQGRLKPRAPLFSLSGLSLPCSSQKVEPWFRGILG